MPSFRAELVFQRAGLLLVAGLDDVGRGAWAGPLFAAAVILPAPTPALRKTLACVDDSKQLTPVKREACAALIREVAIASAVGVVNAAEIDALGMTRATREGMARALGGLTAVPQALLLDAFPMPLSPLPQRAIIRGDSYSFSIASASVIAKVARDAHMCELAKQYPAYGFDQHKGYGTLAHQQALLAVGPSDEHRRSFAPIRELLVTRTIIAEAAA